MAKQKEEKELETPEAPAFPVPMQFKSIVEIVANLSKPVALRHLDKRKQGQKDIHYLAWHRAVKYMDLYAPGWSYEIRSMESIAGKLILTTRVSIPCAEGVVFREATGQEDDDKDSFGDSSSNAESMSLRRACAKFGLGLYLYENDGWKKSIEAPKTNTPATNPAQPKNNAPAPEAKPETKTDDEGLAISPEQLQALIGLCENPPKRSTACDKNEVAKHFSGGRTELLEDLSAVEATKAMDFIRELKDKPATK